VKIVTVFPDTVAGRLPSSTASLLLDGETGAPLALLDGTMLTSSHGLRLGLARATCHGAMRRGC